MTRDEAKRYEQALAQVDRALDFARQGGAIGTREWLEAAEVAQRLANAIKYPNGGGVT